MPRVTWDDANRNPSADLNPLDWASFYVESLKYGPGEGKVELAGVPEMAGQLEILLREAGVASMTGEELMKASMYYGRSLAQSFNVDRRLVMSMWMDALMHGIALGAGLKGEHRKPLGSESR